MSLLGTSKIESLQKKSSDAIGVFTSTVAKLKSANEEVSAESQKREEELRVLSQLEAENSKFITKITEFLES